MRNLTIRRTKSFVGCLGKMKIYIEDPASSEMTINHLSCRKIGELKNGEEKTFPIEEREAKIFVIADKISKDFCNEYYQLPEGQEDIFLSGKNKFNPAAGNAFRFDNNESAGVAENRKRGTRKGLIVLAVAAVVGILVGSAIGSTVVSSLLSGKSPKAKTFSGDNGMRITLTDEFRETTVKMSDGSDRVAYESKEVAVFVLREAFTLMEGFEDYSVNQYIQLVIQANNLKSVEKKSADGLSSFVYTYTNPETGDVYQFSSYVYKTDDAFWTVQFSTLSKNKEKYAARMTEWAKSVTFAD